MTPSGQLSKWNYDKFGQIISLTDSKDDAVGRKAKYTYNKIGQLLEVVYADGSRKSFAYSDLGQNISITAFDSEGKKSETILKYDFFGRLAGKTETVGKNTTQYSYTYNKAGQRVTMQVKRGNGFITNEKRTYDSFGRLLTIENDSQTLSYEYNMRGRMIKQRANGIDIVFAHDKLGRLKTKCLGSAKDPISKLEYYYGPNGQIAAREVNGIKQAYKYDELGQLLSVASNGAILEQYKYDPAGNMLSKSVNGKTTTYKYDASNQLVSSNENGVTTSFEYDAAGRMIQEGNTSYSYNFNNKVVKAGDNTYSYYASGQIANANVNGEDEKFTWDGLALLRRDNTNYLNEPYATGGNPVLAGKKVLFNDMLGTTQGSISKNGKYQASNRTAFGAGDKSGFFTGKPHVEGLGSVFLFRNYRPNQAKWTTSDPIGYPDGWNNLAYVNNMVTKYIDWQGTWTTYSTGEPGNRANTFSSLKAGTQGRSYKTETDYEYGSFTYNTALTTITNISSTERIVFTPVYAKERTRTRIVWFDGNGNQTSTGTWSAWSAWPASTSCIGARLEYQRE